VTRDLTVTAGGALALSEFSGGRFVLGVGVGGSAVGTVGLTADGAAEFRRKLALVKALVAGETATVNGVEVRQSLDVVVIAGSAIGPASAKAVEGGGVTHVLALLMGSDIAGTLEAWSREIMPAWRTPSMAGR